MVVVPRWMYDNTDAKQRNQQAVERMGPGEVDKISFKDLIDLDERYLFHTSIRANIKYLGSNSEISNIFYEENNFGNFKNRIAPTLQRFVRESVGKDSSVLTHFENQLSEISNKRMESIAEITGETKAGYQTKDCKQVIEVLFRTVPLFKGESMENFEIEAIAVKTKKRGVNLNEGSENFEESCGESLIEINSFNTILEGVAGCGKTYYQNNLFDPAGVNGDLEFDEGRSETIVFHPSTSYEDFVSGLRPQKNGSFIGKPGIFVELCNRATADHENNYLLFIDEINRANTAKVFGDLLMVIEESKRTPVEELEKFGRAVLTRREAKELGYTSVRLQTAIDDLPKGANPPKPEYEGDLEYLAVPDNLYIVGTMNSTDRSVGTIDLALRRRFTWQTMEPLTANELREKAEIKNRSDFEELEEVLTWFYLANDELMTKVGPDARLGHSYFFQQNKSAQQIAHDLFKQLAEVAYIFHLEDLMAEEPFNQPILGLYLKNVGEGLGQKVIVEQVSANSREETSGESGIELTASEESSNSSEES